MFGFGYRQTLERSLFLRKGYINGLINEISQTLGTLIHCTDVFFFFLVNKIKDTSQERKTFL